MPYGTVFRKRRVSARIAFEMFFGAAEFGQSATEVWP